MDTNLLIILYSNNIDDYCLLTIDSILNQSYSNFILLLITDNLLNDNELLVKNNIIDDRLILQPSLHKNFYELSCSILANYTFDFLIIHTKALISLPHRFKCQVEYFLLSQGNFNVVSCLDNDSDFDNSFYLSNDIDETIKSGYIPLTIGTLMIKRNVIEKLIKYSNLSFSFADEYSILLEILRYEAIEKIPIVLVKYLFRESYLSFSSKLSLCNSENFIEYREYFKGAFLSPSFIQSDKKQESMNILFLVDSFNIGGTETHILSLINGLFKIGFSVFLACSGGKILSLLTHNNIKHFIISDNELLAINELKKIIIENNIDLIHCHLERSMILGNKLYGLLQIPYIITLHGMFYSYELINNTCINARYVICVSREVEKLLTASFIDIPCPPHKVILNGVNIIDTNCSTVKPLLGLNEKDKYILYCSRLDFSKAYLARILIHNMITILKNDPLLHLVIIGEGFNKKSLQILSRDINTTLNRNAIIFTGALFNIFPYYKDCEFAIGTGRVIIESGLIGKSSICLGLNGSYTILSPNSMSNMIRTNFGDHGFYDSSPYDSLSELICILLYDKSYKKTLEEWSKIWCTHNFDNTKITKEIVSIYRYCINNIY